MSITIIRLTVITKNQAACMSKIGGYMSPSSALGDKE